LYSSIRYLGEDTELDTKLIGWTGEIAPKIRRPWERKKVVQSNKTVVGVANGQLDDLSVPEEMTKANSSQPDEATQHLVCLTKADKLRYQEELKSIKEPIGGKKTELVPVWTLNDADGQSKRAVQETVEKQGRFRKYAEQGTLITDLRLKLVLWPLLHYVLWQETDGREEIKWWKDYVTLNQKFAQKIVELYQPGDISMVPRYYYLSKSGSMTTSWLCSRR
jgi:trehalose 6-phosphate synthase/phosphatase